jgi:hypothetical protein
MAGMRGRQPGAGPAVQARGHALGAPQRTRAAKTTDDACYRAMDWLYQVRAALERQVFGQVAKLLNLEVDLLFFDATSTYWECEVADEVAELADEPAD